MKLEPFDFSRGVNKIDLYQHLCYYHNEADNSMHIIDENKQLAFSNFKKIFHLLRDEYNEYDKVKNHDYIYSNSMYVNYVDNIRDAYVKPTSVNSYKMLSSNLYDIQDYMRYNFNEIFCLDNKYKFNMNNVDNYI